MAVNAANLFAVECDSTVHFGKYSSGTPATLPTDLSAYVAPPGTVTDTFTAGGGWVDAGALTDAPDFSQEFEILEKKVWNSCTTQYVCRQSTDRSVTVSIEELSRTSVEMMFAPGCGPRPRMACDSFRPVDTRNTAWGYISWTATTVASVRSSLASASLR